jgi:uncharacterized protein (DUF2384 family)
MTLKDLIQQNLPTQNDLIRALGITPRTYYKRLKRPNGFTTDELRIISRIIRVPIKDLQGLNRKA